MKEQSLVLKNRIDGIQVTPTVIVLLATCLLPLLIHLIPLSTGAPIGAVLLPIFYLPFIALIFFRKHVALVAALLAPTINFLLTGSPQWELVAILSVELLAFVLLASNLLRHHLLKWLAAPIGYFGAVVIASLCFMVWPLMPNLSAAEFLTQSIGTALPGILVLAIINVVVLIVKR